MKFDNSLPPFPSGWFAVAFSKELKKRKVLSRTFMGQEIVLFRTDGGVATALDAYCPHLGAHLGHGGKVIGDISYGFTLSQLKKNYPQVIFAGSQIGESLVGYYASSDVFVFPSQTDTFGLVQLEALACGLPVVGFNVTRPKDIVPQGCGVGYLAETNREFQQLAIQAWQDRIEGKVSPHQCRAHASKFSWERAVDELLKYLHYFDSEKVL